MLSKLALGGLKPFPRLCGLILRTGHCQRCFLHVYGFSNEHELLKKNSPIGFIPFIFWVRGSLLVIITLVCYSVTPTALLSMRRNAIMRCCS